MDAQPDNTTASDGRRIRRLLNVVGALVAVVGSFWATHLANRSGSWDTTCYESNICDSLTFSAVSELLNGGQTPYVESVRRDHISRTRLAGAPPAFDLPFQYPPNALPLFALRSAATPRVAHVVTAFVTTLLCLLLLWRLVTRQDGDDPRAAVLMVSVSLSPIVAFNAAAGQTGLLAAALVVAVALCWERSPLTAGMLLGVLAFKPQYAAPILVLAAVRRDWRVVTGAAGAFTTLVLVSGIWFGFDEWMSFLHAVREPNHTIPWMVNWMGIAWRVAPDGQALFQRMALPVFVAGAVALGAALWPVRSRTSIEGQLGVVMAWSVLFSPNTHPYDLLVLAPTLVYVSRRSWSGRTGPLFLLVTLCTMLPPFRWVMVLALLGLATFTTVLLRREAKPQGDLAWALTSTRSSSA